MRRYFPVIAVLLLLVATPVFSAPLVKRLVIMVQNGATWRGRCPHNFAFAADVTSRRPGEVTVQWLRSDGARGRAEVQRFTRGNQTIRVFDRWDIGSRYRGWEQVRITDRQGNVASSRRVSFDKIGRAS